MSETLKTIHSLRSVHGDFAMREISNQDLKTILDACVRAATASARQSYSIIVVNDKTDMKEYLHYVGSKALIFCVDYNRQIATADYSKYNFQPNGILDFITGSTDTVLAAQTAAITAKSLGIDSLFTNSIHRGDIIKFYEKFSLPQKYCFPLITLVLGYSADKDQTTRGRLNGPGVIHFDKYHKLSEEEIEEIVNDYDDPDKNMGLVFKRNSQEFTRYMDWFYNVWCKPQDEEVLQRKQAKLYKLLIDAGFIDAK